MPNSNANINTTDELPRELPSRRVKQSVYSPVDCHDVGLESMKKLNHATSKVVMGLAEQRGTEISKAFGPNARPWQVEAYEKIRDHLTKCVQAVKAL